MNGGKKLLVLIILVLLSIGLSAPWQKVADPIFLGFIPAPIFYLLVVHILFVVFIAYLAYRVKLHGKVDDEKAFLAEIQSERRKP
jgi:hypothetical protein